MHPEILLVAVVLSLSSDDAAIVAVAQGVLTSVLATAEMVLGSRAALSALPLFNVLCHLACISCYRREWLNKSGGCAAMAFLVDTMDVAWVQARLVQLSKVP